MVTASRPRSTTSSSNMLSSKPASRQPTLNAHVISLPAGSSHKTNIQPPPATTITAATTTTAAAAAADASDAVKMTFPLAELFDAHVACNICYSDGKSLVAAKHSCRQDVLVVQSKQTSLWFRVRERLNHVVFAGKYHMCNQRPNYVIGKRCPRGDSCTFAHSEVERSLWMAEKEGQFNIREFISQAGSRSKVTALHTIESVLAKHRGQLAFLCRDCYLYNGRVSMQSPANSTVCSVEAHDWLSSAVLAHCSLAAGNITLISRYPASATATDYTLCLMGAFCQRRWRGECAHAHSVLERDVWYMQQETGFTQRQIIQQVVTHYILT